jgi:hypothetical protein
MKFVFVIALGLVMSGCEYHPLDLSCTDRADLIGPSSGQGNGVSCSKDQRMETRDTAGGVLVMCTCVRDAGGP